MARSTQCNSPTGQDRGRSIISTHKTFFSFVLATIVFSGCNLSRSLFSPDKQAMVNLDRAKKRQVGDFGAKIAWEKSQRANQRGRTWTYDFVFYDYGDTMSLIRYMRSKGYPSVSQKLMTKVTKLGCWYSGSSRGYRYGWSRSNNHSVLVRRKVLNVKNIFTNCGEFKETSAWLAISRVIPANMAADAQEKGSRVLRETKETY